MKRKGSHKPGMSIKNKLFYVGSFALVFIYVMILYLGLKPNVTEEYRLYYLTHELKEWPGYENLDYVYGTTEYCTELKLRTGYLVPYNVCMRRGTGWKRSDRYDGTANDSQESVMYYKFRDEAQLAYVKLNVTGFVGKGSVNVFANDELIGTFESTDNYEFELKDINAGDSVTLKFVADKDVTFTLWSISINRADEEYMWPWRNWAY